ncbi:MAG: hypothetical protein WCF65_02215, partial [Parachlamydiaceae bacterium]
MKLMKYVLAATCAFAVVTPSLCSAARPSVGKPQAPKAGKETADPTGITQALAALAQYAALQKTVGVQNVDIAYGMRKALLLADLLIDSNGRLKTELCQSAKAAFVPQQPETYEVIIGNVLDQLDASWQPFFDSIVKPSSKAVAASAVLRGLFSLHVNDAVTDRQAKVAVLSALFAPYNQGPVGDCFAVAGLERDHEKFFRHAASHYAQIVQKGFISSSVGVVQDNFFFVTVLADSDLSSAFTLNSSGVVQGSNLSLFSAPGFAAVSNAVGGENVSSLLQSVLKVLFNGNVKGSINVSPAQVIAATAQVVASAVPGSNVNALLSQGLYAFSSLTNNPVQRSTECAFAAMAEDRVQDYIRGNINSAVAQAIKPAFNSLLSNRKAIALQKALSDKLNSSFRLIYNPSIPLQQVASDGSSSQGGFQLYARVPGDSKQMGKQVATPEDFRQLVLSSISAAELSLGVSKDAHAAAVTLSQYVGTNTFLQDVLWAYDSANQSVSNPVQNYQILSSTPMQSCDGDDPFEVNYVDDGKDDSQIAVGYVPKNTQDLLSWCLSIAKKAPPELCMMNSPQHAFNFDPTNPDIVAFLRSGQTIDYWIRQALIVPSLQVASRQIDANAQAALANGMYSVLSEILPDESQYQALIDKLGAAPLTVQKYTQRLLNGIEVLVPLNAGQKAELELILDGQLIQSLSNGDQAILQKAAIKFAFTNWNDGTKNIYFCAYLNPRTLQVSFASIDEDKTKLYPMDSNEWVNNQQWAVDLSGGDDPTNALVVAQNAKAVETAKTPASQDAKDVAAVKTPAAQDAKDVAAVKTPAAQDVKDVAAVKTPAAQDVKDVA